MALKSQVIVIGGLTVSFLILVILTQTDLIIQHDEETDLPVDPQVNEFNISQRNFAFNVSTIKVSKRNTVRINFINDGSGNHNFGITDLDERTQTISSGNSDTLVFIANRTGTFDFNCSIPGQRENGMLGSFIVE